MRPRFGSAVVRRTLVATGICVALLVPGAAASPPGDVATLVAVYACQRPLGDGVSFFTSVGIEGRGFTPEATGELVTIDSTGATYVIPAGAITVAPDGSIGVSNNIGPPPLAAGVATVTFLGETTTIFVPEPDDPSPDAAPACTDLVPSSRESCKEETPVRDVLFRNQGQCVRTFVP